MEASSPETGALGAATTNKVEMYAGTAQTITANDNVQHRFQAIYPTVAANSSAYIDGSSNAISSPGTGGGGGFIRFCNNASGTSMYIAEAALWLADFSASSNTNAAALDSSQSGFY